jgi:hypothetical protein
MKTLFTSLFLSMIILAGPGCQVLNDIGTQVLTPTTGEMAGGLKDALNAGISQAVGLLGKEGGYFNDPLIKIPFPQEAQVVSKTLRDIGLGNLVNEFEKKLNRGAEEGAKLAAPIFGNAIKKMTFQDVSNILLSNNNQAATDYFKTATSGELYNTFSPKIKQSLDKVGATKAWTDVTTAYNKIPLVKKIETDLVRYATNKAMDGLFSKVAIQEQKIRTDVSARSTDLMKKVFGYADQQKN